MTVEMERTLWQKNHPGGGVDPIMGIAKDTFHSINRTTISYWSVTRSRKMKQSRKRNTLNWSPPPLGWYKINFDATFEEGITHLAVVIGDVNEIFIKAWVSKVNCNGLFSIEASTTGMAFKLGQSLQSKNIIIEENALAVIECILNGQHIGDWRGSSFVQSCCRIRDLHPFSKVNFSPRSCNIDAHNLAA